MQRYGSLLGRVLAVSLLWCCAGIVAAQSNPAFWQVRSDAADVYLLGSIHFGRPDFYPLPPVIEKAFADADVLTVEINIANLNPTVAMASLHRHGRIPEGGSLKSKVSAKTYARLNEVCRQYNVPLTALENFQPWFAAMQLVEVALRSAGLQQHLGIDQHFLSRAAGKQIDELETLDSQLRIFSGLTDAEQESFLQRSLDDLGNSDQNLDAMSTAWKSGDIEALDRELIEPFRGDRRNERLFQKLFVDRNREMLGAVEDYLKSEQTVFFVVGAAHMSGVDGIIAELRKKGHTVEQLSGKSVAPAKTSAP